MEWRSIIRDACDITQLRSFGAKPVNFTLLDNISLPEPNKQEPMAIDIDELERKWKAWSDDKSCDAATELLNAMCDNFKPMIDELRSLRRLRDAWLDEANEYEKRITELQCEVNTAAGDIIYPPM